MKLIYSSTLLCSTVSAHILWIELILFKQACVYVKSLQSHLTVCDPMDHSLRGFPVHGIFQARILEWVAIPSSRGSSWSGDLPDLGIRPASLLASALAGRFFTLETPGKPLYKHIYPLKTYSFHQFHFCYLPCVVAVKYYNFHKILYLTT